MACNRSIGECLFSFVETAIHQQSGYAIIVRESERAQTSKTNRFTKAHQTGIVTTNYRSKMVDQSLVKLL